MFTGIIEKSGLLTRKTPGNNLYKLQFTVKDIWNDLALGESISVNGVCLTVTSYDRNGFTADVSIPTLRDTTLKDLKLNSKVNLERSMKLGGRFGGHIVQGHVDGTGTIQSKINKDGNIIISIGTTDKLLEYIIDKASVAIDGVSLTVQGVVTDHFTIVLIPHSAEYTNIADLMPGMQVNIEIDMFAKYTRHFLSIDKVTKEKSLKETLNRFI